MDAKIYQSFDPNLPVPIAFSGWKHHMGFIATSINKLSVKIDDATITAICHGIGGSMLDLYIGNLSPENIASEILEKVKCNGALVKEKFTHWVCNSGDNYQQVTISDGSYWTLRLGRYPERYVHIHPSRYAINTIRARPTALKTVIAYSLKYPDYINNIDIQKINQVRLLCLNLSPLKEGVVNHQIFRILRYVNI